MKNLTPTAQRAAVVALLLSILCPSQASAGETELASEYSKKIQGAQVVTTLGPNLAGDSTSLYTGATSFNIVDVSLPGAGPAVALGRSFVVEEQNQEAKTGTTYIARQRLFGDWDLDVPSLGGVYSNQQGWDIDSTTPTKRCTVLSQTSGNFNGQAQPAAGSPRVYPVAFPQWFPSEFWSGITLNIPGGGSQTLLVADQAGVPKPTTGGPYHWTTKDDWWFSCLNSTTNATTTTNAGGEAFVALSPDGTKYTLSHLSKRWVTQLHEKICTLDGIENPLPPFDGECDHRRMTRKEYTLLPTRVEDRFGNWVSYTWSTDEFAKLLNITAKDGRTITLGYNSQGKVSTVSDGTRTWTYTYLADGSSLTTVTLPDTSKWQYAFVGLHVPQALGYSCADIGEPFNCYSPPPHPIGGSGEVTHPSGAVIGFSFDNHFKPTTDGLGQSGSYPLGLSSKTLSGPGLTPATWTFSYLPTRDEFKAACASQPGQVGCLKTVSTTSVAPDGSVVRSTFGIEWATNQGLLLSEQAGKMVSGAPVFSQTTAITYTDPAVTTNGFVVTQGTNPLGQDPSLLTADYIYTTRRQPIQSRVTTLQAVDFKWQATSFDTFARPTTVTRFSVGNAAGDKTRTDTTSYLNDVAKWVVGLEDTVTYINGSDGATAKVIRHTDYDANSRLPWKTYAFGALQGTMTYNADGNLSTITDPNGYTTTASIWYRGIPKLISFPATPGSPGSPATTLSANVSPLGWISDVTDQLGSKNCYSYDAMGRISLITYTSEAGPALCNATTWAPTNAAFVPVASAEYGLPAGHWRQTVYTGNGRTTTYYDARWQPVLTLAEDTSNVATRSFTVARYDTMGRQTFKSYPVATLTSVNDTLKGLRTTYGDLGRVVQVQQDSESVGGQAVLNTNTEYLGGFQTRVTNPRGKQTVTGYQVLDSPSTDSPLSISLPEGVWTTITRDIFGKPKSVSRSGIYAGNALGLTRYYVYDAYARLCQTINPESGTTIVDYDAAGNPLWSAEGQTATGLTALTCAADRTATATAVKTSRVYDALNRVMAVNTPGGVADVDTTYYADGKINTLTAANPGGNNVSTTYTYNRRRLLTREQLQVNALTPWGFDYAYNANGHLNSQTYPGSLLVGYAPDALGRPTQAGTFASNATYYPNGAISGFTYGNGIVHTMTQNDRRLPARSLDAYGATKVLDDTYTYDGNGNVLSMADAAGTGANDRTWGVAAPTVYDGLDRLLSVRGTNWGTLTGSYNALYSYDPLDNIRSAKIGASGYTHAYDLGTPSNTNRLVSMQLNGGTTFALGTDAAGNITSDARTSHGYQFDVAHRLTAVTGPGAEGYLYDGNGRRARTLNSTTGTIEYFGYGADGRLLSDWSNRRQVRNQYIYLGNTLVGLNEVSILNFTVAPRYKHTDALGSPVATTDSGKNVTGRTVYTPYGIPMTPVDGVGYTGHFEDLGTGLTYMQQRYYDPGIGRFLSVDPMASDTTTGWNFNRYNYAANNPYKFTDPDGRSVACTRDSCTVQCTSALSCGAGALTVLLIYAERLVENALPTTQNSETNDEPASESPPVPGELVGEADSDSGQRGERYNNGPLSPANGGTGNAETDFGQLTGGQSGPAPAESTLPAGSQVGANGVILRPSVGSAGPRIDIPANGTKPHETLHYPKPPPPPTPEPQ